MKATFMKFDKKCQICHFISQTSELRPIEQRHGLLSKPNQEQPFCDMLQTH